MDASGPRSGWVEERSLQRSRFGGTFFFGGGAPFCCIFGYFMYSVFHMVVRMRHTKSHSANRRSHHALTCPRLSLCINCGAPHLRHRMCANCGTYRKREVVNVVAIAEKKATRAKAKARSLGQEPDATKAKEARKEHKH